MVITKIERQKRHPRRMNVYADGEFAFGLHEEVLMSFGLRKGDSLDSAAVKALESAEECTLAKEKALRLLSYRLRSEKELRSRLRESEFHPSVIDRTIEDLRAAHLVDDEAFARAFVSQSLMRRPAGKTLIQRELRSRGIPREIVLEVVQERFGGNEEYELALRAGQKMAKRLEGRKDLLDERQRSQKIASYLLHRGFGWSTIKPVLNTIMKHDSPILEEA